MDNSIVSGARRHELELFLSKHAPQIVHRCESSLRYRCETLIRNSYRQAPSQPKPFISCRGQRNIGFQRIPLQRNSFFPTMSLSPCRLPLPQSKPHPTSYTSFPSTVSTTSAIRTTYLCGPTSFNWRNMVLDFRERLKRPDLL